MTITIMLSSKTVGEEFAEARERRRIRKAAERAKLLGRVAPEATTDWQVRERVRKRVSKRRARLSREAERQP